MGLGLELELGLVGSVGSVGLGGLVGLGLGVGLNAGGAPSGKVAGSDADVASRSSPYL